MRFSILPTCLLLLFSCKTSENEVSEQHLVATYFTHKQERMDIQYAYTILYVKDVPSTMEFYHKVFGFTEKLLTPEKDYGELETGGTILAFANFELGRSNFKAGFAESHLQEKAFGIELAFATSSVETTLERAIDNGAVLLAEVVTKPWGQKVGYVRDLNGFIVEICTPMQSQN